MEMKSVATAAAVLACFFARGSPANLVAAEEIPSERVHEIGVQAYLSAYPMLLLEVTRQVSTNVPAPAAIRHPWFQTNPTIRRSTA